MTDYKLLAQQIRALADGEPDYMPVFYNASALIMENMENLNWAGFYLMNHGSLLLGPFQGKVACIRIQMGRGVCGVAAQKDETQLVKDVHEFPGHIACDAASSSELVVPVHAGGRVVAVLDLDSPLTGRFTQKDREGMELFVKTLEEVTAFEGLRLTE